MQERLKLVKPGNPLDPETMIGSQVSKAQYEKILNYIKIGIEEGAAVLAGGEAGNYEGELSEGYYIQPTVLKGDNKMRVFQEEIFGPVLHVVRFKAGEKRAMVDRINASGYGLTLGIHSRIDMICDDLADHANVGNIYINRNQIGAVVGVQPFGGQGLSGTGPKAGGPNYLQRFATERTRTINTTAVGGNATLLANAQGK